MSIYRGKEEARPLRSLFFELGQALFIRKRYAEAADAFQQALREEGSSPDNGEIFTHLARSQHLAGNNQSAFHNYLEAIAYHPKESSTILPYVQELLSRKIVKPEQEWLQYQWMPTLVLAELSEVEQARLKFLLARIHLYLDMYSQALSFFQQALQVLPDDVLIIEGAGEAAWQTGDLKQAVESLYRARDLVKQGKHPERSASINVKLAKVLAEDSQYAASLSLTTDSLSESGSSTHELLLIRGTCYLALGQPEKALNTAHAALERDMTSLQGRLLYTQALIALNRYKEALSSINQILQSDPSSTDQISLYKSQILLEGGIDLKQGEQLLQLYVDQVGREEAMRNIKSPTITARSKDPYVHYFLAQCYNILARPEEVLQEVNRALELESGDKYTALTAQVQQLKAEILESVDKSSEAAHWYDEAGRQYTMLNELEVAIDLLTKAKSLDPTNACIYWDLAHALCLDSYLSVPPYVDEEKIEKSQALWEEGIKIALPKPQYSWAYVVRAFINERLAILYDDLDRRLTLLWEAIVYLERAILLQAQDPNRWAYLGRYHRMMRNEVSALRATGKALEYDDKNILALDERAKILADIGEYAEAEAIIDKRQRLEQNIWADALKADVLLHSGRYSEARELTTKIIQLSPEDVWYRYLHALSCILSNDQSSARKDCEWIWTYYEYHPTDRNNLSEYGFASYYLGKLDQAISIYIQLLDDPTQKKSSIYWSLGLCYLLRGDLPAGKKNLEQSVETNLSTKRFDDLPYHDLEYVKNTTAKKPESAQIQIILASIYAKIAAARSLQHQLDSTPEEELEQVISQSSQRDRSSGRAGIAAQAGLARFYTENKRWPEAIALYQLLQKQPKLFPEAQKGLEVIAREARML